MLLILFNQQELDTSDVGLANRLSAFNFCNPFDHILPFANGTINDLDRAHLWGVYSGSFGTGEGLPCGSEGLVIVGLGLC